MATTIRACIYTRGEVRFAKFLFLPNCWRPIFHVLPKLDECQVVCQTVGVALSTTKLGVGLYAYI
jgi:hypothetical protein